MRPTSVAILSAGLVLAAVGRAEAVTYGPITLSIPVKVDAAIPNTIVDTAGSTFSIRVTCKSGTVTSVKNVPVTGPSLTPNQTEHLTYGGPNVLVFMPAGLKSGSTIACTIAPEGSAAASFLVGLTVDTTKTSTQLVLP